MDHTIYTSVQNSGFINKNHRISEEAISETNHVILTISNDWYNTSYMGGISLDIGLGS